MSARRMANRTLEIEIDLRACRGRRQCVFRAPHTFTLTPGGKVRLKEGWDAGGADAAGDSEASILDAALACPRFAVLVAKVGTGAAE